MTMEPIAHQSLAARDLNEAREFYVEVLGCPEGRRGAATIDVWLFGTQVTLHHAPAEVSPATDRLARHFGVTLGRADFDAVMARLDQHPTRWLRPRRTDYEGTSPRTDESHDRRPEWQRHRVQDVP